MALVFLGKISAAPALALALTPVLLKFLTSAKNTT